MNTTPTAATRLGGFVAEFAQTDLPPEVSEKAGVHLLDAVGLALIGAGERTAQAAKATSHKVASAAGTARIWGTEHSAVPADAIFANAVAVHAHFHDDSEHSSWTHPGSFVVPVAICGGEALNLAIKDALRAVAVGYATAYWLGAKQRVASAMIARGVRTSPTLGTIAAAATGAVLLRLDAAAAANAVAMAASLTGGTLEPVRCGSDEWRAQNGSAAAVGWRCAQLASHGVCGAPLAFEGPKGLARSMAGLEEMPFEWQEPPPIGAILRSYVKRFATLGDNMPAARAAKLLHADGLDPSAIKRVTVGIWEPYTSYPGTSYRGPFETPVQALASTVFAVSAMLIYGELEYDKASDHRADPRILSLVQRVEVVAAEDATHLDAVVTVELNDDTQRRRRASEAPITWLYPTAETATQTFSERLGASGHDAYAAKELAGAVFNAKDSVEGTSVRLWLDALGRNSLGH